MFGAFSARHINARAKIASQLHLFFRKVSTSRLTSVYIFPRSSLYGLTTVVLCFIYYIYIYQNPDVCSQLVHISRDSACLSEQFDQGTGDLDEGLFCVNSAKFVDLKPHTEGIDSKTFR